MTDTLDRTIADRAARLAESATLAVEFADSGDTVFSALLPSDPEPLAVEGGDPANELHVTLCYLGKVDEVSPEAADALAQFVAGLADRGPIEATITEVGLLGHDEPPAVVGFLDSPDLHALHEELTAALEAFTDEDAPRLRDYPEYRPHITFGYDLDPEAVEDRVGTTIVLDGAVATGSEAAGQVALVGGVATGGPTGDGEETLDAADEALAASATTEAEATPDGTWEGVLVVEGMESGDGRSIDRGGLTWRELPLPLMAMLRNPEGGSGHDGAELAGSIDWIERRGDEVHGGGRLDLESEMGAEVHRLMSADPPLLRGVSVDLDKVEADMDVLGQGGGQIHKARVMGASVVPFPSFQEAIIRLTSETDETESALAASGATSDGAQAFIYTPWDTDGLVASAGIPVAPPRAWFDPPSGEEVLALRARGASLDVEGGRIYGIAALTSGDDSCHIGMRGCVRPPASRSNYAYYQTGTVVADDGTRVEGTGTIVGDTVHPNLRMRASDAQSFYAHTGCAMADVRCYDMVVGGESMIVFAGALRPGVTPAQLRVLRGSDGVSPDWRSIGGRREMVALLVVNNTGFKVPALVASGGADDLDGVMPGEVRYRLEDGEVTALVAAGTAELAIPSVDAQVADLERTMTAAMSALRADLAALADEVGFSSSADIAEGVASEVAPADDEEAEDPGGEAGDDEDEEGAGEDPSDEPEISGDAASPEHDGRSSERRDALAARLTSQRLMEITGRLDGFIAEDGAGRRDRLADRLVTA